MFKNKGPRYFLHLVKYASAITNKVKLTKLLKYSIG